MKRAMFQANRDFHSVILERLLFWADSTGDFLACGYQIRRAIRHKIPQIPMEAFHPMPLTSPIRILNPAARAEVRFMETRYMPVTMPTLAGNSSFINAGISTLPTVIAAPINAAPKNKRYTFPEERINRPKANINKEYRRSFTKPNFRA